MQPHAAGHQRGEEATHIWLDELPAPHRFNILIVGSERGAEAELERLPLLLPDPVHTCELPGHLRLPDECGAALILRNVGALNLELQAELASGVGTQ